MRNTDLRVEKDSEEIDRIRRGRKKKKQANRKRTTQTIRQKLSKDRNR